MADPAPDWRAFSDGIAAVTDFETSLPRCDKDWLPLRPIDFGLESRGAEGKEAADPASAGPDVITYRLIARYLQALRAWRKEVVFRVGDHEIGRTTISLFGDVPRMAGAEPAAPEPPRYVNAPVDASVHEYWSRLHQQIASGRQGPETAGAGAAPLSEMSAARAARGAPLVPADRPRAPTTPSPHAPQLETAIPSPPLNLYGLFGSSAQAAEVPEADRAQNSAAGDRPAPAETSYRRADGESEEAWQHRLFDAAAAAERQLWQDDPAAAATAADRLGRIEAAIEGEPGFLDRLPAYQQSVDPEFYADPQRWIADHGLPGDALTEAPPDTRLTSPDGDDPAEDFIRNNGVQYYKLAADGKIYDISEAIRSGADPRLRRLPTIVNVYSHLSDALTRHKIREGDPDALWEALLESGLEFNGGTAAKPPGLGIASFGRPTKPTAGNQGRSQFAPIEEGRLEPSTKPREPSHVAPNTIIPNGFANAGEFNQFGAALHGGLAEAGYGDAQGILQGSAVTGVSFRTGIPFDVGRVSDFDVALSGDSLFQGAQDAGIGLRAAGTRTGPLNELNLQQLNLFDLSTQLSSQYGRPVNFMIYNSTDAAVARAPSIIIPK